MNSPDTYILFQLAGATYGVPSDQVLHVDMLENVTPVPNTAAAVEGVVFSRGQVIPALNLRVRFGLPREAHTSSTRLIFLRAHQRTIAFIADSAREFRRIPQTNIRPLTETLHGIRGNYVKGVATLGDRFILLLDIPAVLDLEEVQALGGVAEAAAPARS
jgi:purine-binding chemotaxis protein CheW